MIEDMKEKLLKVKKFYNDIQHFIIKNPPKKYSSGFLEYILTGSFYSKIAIGITGRFATPSIVIGGIHMFAANFALNGIPSIIISAHRSSRKKALSWLINKSSNDQKICIFGHSHGADHASCLSNEYFKNTGKKIDLLVTIDPVNSPFPIPLSKISNINSVKIHNNYYQRNFIWFGGSIKTANNNINVSDCNKFPSWSNILVNEKNIDVGINHRTIDEDLFLNGNLFVDF